MANIGLADITKSVGTCLNNSHIQYETIVEINGDTYTINSGEQVKIKLVVDDKGSNVGLKHCVLDVVGDVSGDTKRTLLIRVTQKKGIFG